ncbi:alpha/beta hydrolase [Streptomyces sp. ISL-11]|uniref:alpha/beta hydrolase n=1 Tax=Streptomyces sp. ISL-11 TaxID=2819174 RepID=UPI001BE5DEC6|nr:alpha/beta fold hydrolase [Streptomyces sp. ISL-11]MBT2386283.1 alpha/beta fold hydrolase [Streptomyces sp. ISL-11]
MTSVRRRAPRPARRSRLSRVSTVSLPLAAATVLAHGLAGCAGVDRTAGAPDLGAYYEQTVDWKPCAREADREVRRETARATGTAECGRLTVPYSYAAPGKGELRLALMRYRAQDPGHRRGSLVVNFGGPGASGLKQLTAYGPDGLSHARTGYDLVTFDPRGVGASSPVRCGGGRGSDDGSGTDDMADALAAQEKALKHCKTEPGAILPHVNTVNTAQDLDVLRAALGQDKLDYLGFSYGSRLGAVYAHRFPGKVGRMVMDGVDEPSPDLKQTTLTQTAAYHRALRHAVTTCTRKGDEDCALGPDTDHAMEQIERAFDHLDDAPLDWPGGRKLDRATAVTETMGLLRSRQGLPEVPNLMAALVHHVPPGESAEMARAQADDAEGKGPDGSRDNSADALTAINCADTAARYRAEQVVASYDEFLDASPVFGPTMAMGMGLCTGWPTAGDDSSHDVAAATAPKILMHTSEYDPATPVRWLAQMARAVGSAVTMTDTGGGHSVYGSPDAACVNERIDAFLLDGVLPPNRTRCR